jgi:hypothetical protein
MNLVHPSEFLNDIATYLTQGIVDIPLSVDGEHEWNEVFSQLEEWRSAPSSLEDDGVEAPLERIIQGAEETGLSLKEQGVSSPESVLPDGDGGVVFRWSQENSSGLSNSILMVQSNPT